VNVRMLATLTGVVVFAVAGSAQTPEAAKNRADETPGPGNGTLARLVTDAGTQVEFLEPIEGRIVVVEEGGPGQRPALAE